jgi:hypothetical protein
MLLTSVRKTAGADGKEIGRRLTASFDDDVVKGMADAAARMADISGNIIPVLYTESVSVRDALTDKVDTLFATVVFGENKTAEDQALASMRDVAAMKLSQQKKAGQIHTPDDLNEVLAELLKQLPNVFKYAGKNQVTIENSALAGLASELNHLVAQAATAKSA